jgi:hypothetical protein
VDGAGVLLDDELEPLVEEPLLEALPLVLVELDVSELLELSDELEDSADLVLFAESLVEPLERLSVR